MLWEDENERFAFHLRYSKSESDGLYIPANVHKLKPSTAKVSLLSENGSLLLPVKYRNEKWIECKHCKNSVSHCFNRTIVPGRKEATHIRNKKQTDAVHDYFDNIFMSEFETCSFAVAETDITMRLDDSGFVIVQLMYLIKEFQVEDINRNITLDTKHNRATSVSWLSTECEEKRKALWIRVNAHS